MFATAIVGAGPGGTGPLVFAAQEGVLDDWLSMGVVVMDRDSAFGGTIGRYAVNSDTLGSVYLEFLDAPTARRRFAPLRAEPSTKDLESQAHGFPPLPLVGQYFRCVGRALHDAVNVHPASVFLGGMSVSALRLRPDGTLAIATNAGGSDALVLARTAILALGGRPAPTRTAFDELNSERTIVSDELLTHAGLAKAAALLRSARKPRIVILGGSHSAYSSAWALLNLIPGLSLAEGSITIACRRDPKIYYPTRADARSDEYTFDEADICPRTQRVNRLAGLRGDGRELWRGMSSRAGTTFEDRVRTLRCDSFAEPELAQLVDAADLVVRAFGYVSRTVPIFDARGQKMSLNADAGGRAVDDQARVLLSDGNALQNVFALGLGSGYRPHGAMGGEPSFRGQANSLWLYQNDIGGMVYTGVQEYLRSSGHGAIESRLRAGGAR